MSAMFQQSFLEKSVPNLIPNSKEILTKQPNSYIHPHDIRDDE